MNTVLKILSPSEQERVIGGVGPHPGPPPTPPPPDDLVKKIYFPVNT